MTRKIIPITELEEERRPVGCLPCIVGYNRDGKADAAVIDDVQQSITGICAHHAEVGEEAIQRDLRRRRGD